MRTSTDWTLIAQQDNNAYGGGRMVGQIVGYIFIAVIVLWVIGKVFRRR